MTAGAVGMPSGEDHAPARDRRIDRARHSIEMLLDEVFRPGHWAAAVSYRVGLQGRIRAHVTEMPITGLPSVRPLRLAFASDFHAGATTDWRLIEAACLALGAFAPDVLLLGGDFVSVRASYADRLAELLGEIRAPFGKFAVLGNHDLRADRARVVRALCRAEIELVANGRRLLPAPFDHMTLCGLDDPTRGRPRADLALDGATGARIVLMHSPQGLDAIGERAFDVALCGHTHGGQVALPSGRALIVPSGALNRRFVAGEFRLPGAGARRLLVSRGVGCSTLPVRLFAAPEVHLCLIR